MECMDVFYASDDGYAQHLCVSMASVLRHAQWPVRFHVLDGGISESNKAVITKHVKKFPHSEIEFIVVDNDLFKDFPISERFTVASYYRCIIHELRPNIDKAIYLDCDVVARCCLGELFNINVIGYYAAVVEDPNIMMDARKGLLDLPDDCQYFNSGVLLLNLRKIRKESVFEKIRALINKYEEHLTFQDQDLLNMLFFQKVKFLEPSWNVMEIVYRNGGRFCQHRFYTNEFFDDCANNPRLIHYADRSTLWFKKPNTHLHKFWLDYYRYLRTTDFYRFFWQFPVFLLWRTFVTKKLMKQLRRWLFRIHFTDNSQIVRLFGVYIMNRSGTMCG